MESKVEQLSNTNDPIFEIKKWNAVALWAWGKIFKFYLIIRYTYRYLCNM